MSARHSSLKKIEEEIRSLDRNLQQKLLSDLPDILNLNAEDVSLLKLTESAFDFWDNPEDAEYDSL